MASVRTLATLKRGGVYHLPGSTFHDLTDHEVAELGEHVIRLDALADAPGSPGAAIDPVLEAAVIAVAVAAVAAPVTHPDAPIEPPVDEDETEGTRIDNVRAALDLLEAGDFTAAGRPKVQSLADVLGFRPTADEITTALALREEEGL